MGSCDNCDISIDQNNSDLFIFFHNQAALLVVNGNMGINVYP